MAKATSKIRPAREAYVKPHIQYVPNARVAVVLSCPGEAEERAGYPAAGTTGRNLDRLLERMSRVVGPRFQRHNIIITNAWPKVISRKRDGISEAPDASILTAGNLHRLEKEIKGVSVIVASGRKAQLAVKAIYGTKPLKSILFIPHVGMLGLQHVDGPNTDERLDIIAHFITANHREPGVARLGTKKRLASSVNGGANQPFVSALLKQLRVEQETYVLFSLLFARFEHSLKVCGYCRDGNSGIQIHWRRFASEFDAEGERQYLQSPSYQDARAFLLRALPMQQYVHAERDIRWRETDLEEVTQEGWSPAQNEDAKLAELVKTLRNNLFHGGKFHNPHQLQNRNQELLEAAIVVLENWSRVPRIRGAFYEGLREFQNLSQGEAA
jgi:hypothetical protein